MSLRGSDPSNRVHLDAPAPVVVVPKDEDRLRWYLLEKDIPAAKDRVAARRVELAENPLEEFPGE